MTMPKEQEFVASERRSPVPQNLVTPSLDELTLGARDLYTETTAQIRGIGELAFMELELAIRSLQWGIWTLFMFGACSVMAGTFLLMAIVLVLIQSSVPPAAIMLLCGMFSATAALFLFFGLRSLTKRMTFTNLRGHLTQVRDEGHVEP
jgi:hypothetical protein